MSFKLRQLQIFAYILLYIKKIFFANSRFFKNIIVIWYNKGYQHYNAYNCQFEKLKIISSFM